MQKAGVLVGSAGSHLLIFQHTLPTPACSLGRCCVGSDRSCSVEPEFKEAGLASPHVASCRSWEIRPAHQWKLSGRLSRHASIK